MPTSESSISYFGRMHASLRRSSFFFLFLSSFLASQAQWTGASILNNQAHFQAIAFVGDTGLYVYGTGCVPRASVMGMVYEPLLGTGQGYDFLNTTTGVLRDVDVFREGGERFFYAVGASGTFSDTNSVVVKRTEGGGLWQFDTLHTGNHRYYNALHFLSAAEGFAVGGTSFGDGILDRTLDSGRTWQQEQLFLGEQVSDVFFLSPELGFLTTGGIRWLSCSTQEFYPAGSIHRSIDGGASWEVVHSDGSAGFTSVVFHAPLLGCATRADGVIVRTMDGGDTWSEATIQVDPPFLLTGLSVSPSGAWYASGFRTSGTEGLIFSSLDGGATWTQNHSTAGVNYARRIYDVQLYDDDFGMAAGNTRNLRTENGGGLPTGINRMDLGGMQLSPNPATGEVLVQLPTQEKFRIRFTDMQGRLMLEHQSHSGMIPLRDLVSGIYLVVAEQDGQRYIQRLVVE